MSQQEDRVVIKKYSNRRLYDTSASKYVTLADVARTIRQGREIRVVDAKTGEDLTRAVMLQIIAESRTDQEALPVSLLQRVIRAADKGMRESIRDYLSNVVGAQRELQKQFAGLARVGAMLNPLLAPWLSSVEEGVAPPPDPQRVEAVEPSADSATVAEEVGPGRKQTTDQNAEIALLRAQLAAMQEKIDSLQPRTEMTEKENDQ